MATTRIYLTGIAVWAKLFERNRDRGEFHEATDGITCVNIVLEKEEMDALKKAGSRLRPTVMEEGLAVKVRRPWIHDSIPEFGGQAQIVDKDGKEWDSSVAIGNGSKIEVALDIYDTAKGKGTRLAGVKVLDLVEYESPEGASNLPY